MKKLIIFLVLIITLSLAHVVQVRGSFLSPGGGGFLSPEGADFVNGIAGTTNEITVTDDGDNTVTISLPTAVNLGASSNLTTIGFNFTSATGTTMSLSGSLRVSSTLSVEAQTDFRASTTLPTYTSCTALETSSSGLLLCGVDDTGGGSATAPTSSVAKTIEFPSNSEDWAFWIAPTNATATSFYSINKTTGDTVNFNVYFGQNRNAATSTMKALFLGFQASSATTTATSSAINGSSTIVAGDVFRFTNTNGSSTEFTFTLGYIR